MAELRSPQTSVNVYQTRRRNIPESSAKEGAVILLFHYGACYFLHSIRLFLRLWHPDGFVHNSQMRCEVHTAAVVNTAAFWDVTPC
jgi:hypothetical protein